MQENNPVNANNQQNALPGLSSPLFLMPLVMGTGFLFFGKDDSDYNRAINLFAIAGTALMTDNITVRSASAVGGFMRTFGPATLISRLGFLAQGGAIAYALCDSMRGREENLNMQEQAAPRSQ